jgi:putative ABC transport system permease protein
MIHDHPEADSLAVPGEEGEPKDREMTAYLLIKRTPMAQMILPKLIQDTNLQLALPAIEMNRLSQNFGLGMDAMKAIAVLIMVLSFISVFISLFNSLKARKYELALMRSMGGSRASLFLLLLLEGAWLVFLGFAVGMLLSRLGLYVLSQAMEENFHYSVADMSLHSSEVVLFAVTLAVGIVASFLPAVRAFRMDISKTLSNG